MTVTDLSSEAISQMRSDEQVDEALQRLVVDEKRIGTVRRELMNRKALLNAAVYVVVRNETNGQQSLFGVSSKYDVQTPDFGLRLGRGAGTYLVLIKEMEEYSFLITAGFEFTVKKICAETDSEEPVTYHLEIFSTLADAQGYMQQWKDALLSQS